MGHHTLTGQLSLWTVPERSRRFMQAAPGLVFNRLLYIGGAALSLIVARASFSLPALVGRVRTPARTAKRSDEAAQVERSRVGERFVPTVVPAKGIFRSLRVSCHLALREIRITWSGTAFRVVIAAVVLLGFLGARFGSTDYYSQPEQHLLPAAQYLLELVDKQMFLMLVMIGVYFGSEMLARDRAVRMATLIDAVPVSTNALAGGKCLGMTFLALTLAPLPALTVFLFQLFGGYRELVPAHFLRSFLQIAPQVIVYCWIAMVIYSLTRSKIASQAISILLLFSFAILHSIDAIEQHFFILGLPTDLVFSDFRVMAASNERHLSFDTWYIGVTGMLVVLATWLWPRGTDAALSKRVSQRRSNVSWVGVASLGLALVLVAAGSITAWRNIHVEHLYRSLQQEHSDAETYEKQFAGDESWPQPRVQSVRLHVTVDPKRRSMRYVGLWKLSNPTSQPMDRIHVEMPESADPLTIDIHGAPVAPESWDRIHRVGIWRLPQPLAPGETLDLETKSGVWFRGFEEKPFEGTMGDDTAWFNTSFLPHFGYSRSRELDAPAQRSEYGLDPRKARATHNGLLAINDEAGWVDLDLFVSVPAAWAVSANGEQRDQVTQSGQKTVHFEAKQIPLSVQVVAGRLTTHVATMSSRDGRQIPVTLSYRAGHGENVERLTQMIRASFAEWERRFGPCPSAYINLAEIPQYQTGGEPDKLTPVTAAGGMIVMPERLGWLHDYRTQPARDWLAYVLAQNVARSWWGNRIASREGAGSALVDDGVPILLGLNMIEKLHGVKAADDYASLLQDRLRKEMARESGPAPTILTTDFQDFADTQAALALYDQRRKNGREAFDHLLDQSWQALSSTDANRSPASPELLARPLGLIPTEPHQN